MSFISRIAPYLLALCLVAAPYHRIHADKGTPGGEKTNPVAIMAILIEPAPTVASSCEPGRPLVFLKVRVANKGRANAPALPASEGIEAYDGSSPPWRGTAALPALRAGEVVEETIAMNAPANPATLAGKHYFRVHLAMKKNQTEQVSSAAVVVDIPAGLCRSLRPGMENVESPTPTPTPRNVNVPAQPPRQQRPVNEPEKHN